MQLWELFLIAVSLSMDAFAVALCKGLSVKHVKLRHMFIVGFYFGLFQLLMPLIGYLLGSRFQALIVDVDHWIAFILLALIGANMIREALKAQEDLDPSFRIWEMLPLAVATSIDALAVGVTFAFLQVRIVPAVCFIGVTTFILSALGVKLGSIFGQRYRAKAQLLGGIVLILMGLKILLEHLAIL